MSKKYRVIYSDPPWYYAKRNKQTSFGAGIYSQYEPMHTDDICRLGTYGQLSKSNCPRLPAIREITEDNAVLFMWTTSQHLALGEATQVIKAWGFRPVCVGFAWNKCTKGSQVSETGRGGKDINCLVLPGHYTGQNNEYLMIGVKGSCLPDIAGTSTAQIVIHAREKNHSEKPAIFREHIDRMYPTGNRLELFCRHAPEGWDVWGNDVGKLE